MTFFLPVFADCGSPAEARGISARLGEALAPLAPAAPAIPAPYWKIPSEFAFTFRLQPTCTASFDW